jgi:hypothetical protein
MAATQPASAPPAEDVQTSKSTSKLEKLVKVDKPDDEKYKTDLADADKQLTAFNEKLVTPFIPLVKIN